MRISLPKIVFGRPGSILILIAVFFACNGIVLAQKSVTAETYLKKKAENRFKSDDYVSALPLYSQLLSLYPKNPEYNYRYGVCLLQSSKDKATAVSYLENASRSPKTDEEVFFYLGKSYMFTNNFNEAIRAFENFKKRAGAGKAKKMDVDLLTGNCKSAIELMKNRRNVVIINQQQVVRNSFYGAYVSDSSSGKLLVTPERFLSSRDKEKMLNPLMFLTADGQTIYYASYGKKSEQGKDIYRITKQMNGSWAEPENLGIVINTGQDEDYPFLDRDGITLYFCSKGHNSMGGYDIFKSVFLSSDEWSEPENAGIPVNTPDDDIFYMPNATGDYAQYSCAMESDLGKIGVRKIKLGDVVNQLAVINGRYYSEDQPQRRDAKISVIRIKDNGLVTTVRTDPRSGNYVIQVPQGDDYTLVVEAGGYIAHAENFSVPEDPSLANLKQEVKLNKSSEAERMTLSNYFTVSKISSDQPLAIISAEPTNVISNEYRLKDGEPVKLQPIDIKGRMVYVTPPKNVIETNSDLQSHALYEQNANGDSQKQNGRDKTNVIKTENAVTEAQPEETKTETGAEEKKDDQTLAQNQETKKEAGDTEVNERKVKTPPPHIQSEKAIPGNVSNNELVRIAYEDAKFRKSEAQAYSDNATITRQMAEEQDSVAQSQLMEVMQLLNKGGLQNKEKAKLLVKESEDNHLKANARFDKAQELDTEAKQLHSEADVSMQEAQLLMKSTQPESAKTAVSKSKTHASSSTTKDNKVVASSVQPKKEKRKTEKHQPDLKENKEKEKQPVTEANDDIKNTSSGRQDAKTGAESFSSSQPGNQDINNDGQPVAINPVSESGSEEIHVLPASGTSVEKTSSVAFAKAKQSYIEYGKMLEESKELASQADEMQNRVDNMPSSPKRESLITKSNDISILSIKKWQQAQEKLSEAKQNDPGIEAKMKEVEQADQAVVRENQTSADDPKKISTNKNLVASNTHLKNSPSPVSDIADDKKNVQIPLDATSPLYSEYLATTSEIKTKQAETIDVFAEAMQLNKLAQEKRDEEIRVRDNAALLTNSKKKKEELKKADALKHEADSLVACSNEKFQAAQHITGEVAVLNDKALKLKQLMSPPVHSKQNEATASINERENKSLQSKIKPAYAEASAGKPAHAESSAVKNLSPDKSITAEKQPEKKILADATPFADRVTPDFMNASYNIRGENIFSITSKSAYSESHPIPIDPGLPEGLIFKVQIGAFHSPLPANSFKNLQPVTGETTRPGWIRYCVGLFKAFEAANLLKSEMKTIGYKDAFVVAYYNGKRIPLSIAYSLIGRSGTEEKKLYASSIKNETSHLNSLNIASPKLNDPNDADVNFFYGSSAYDSKENTTMIEYAVQVGVYKSSRVPNALVSLVPLQAEQIRTGLYRFMTGHYSLYASADSSKRAAISAGVKDAFIVKYKNGTDMALNRNKTVSEETNVAENINKAPSQHVKLNSTPSANHPVGQVIYKVQVGAFHQKLSGNAITRFEKISAQEISSEMTATGLNIIYAGTFTDLGTALSVKNDIVARGIKDAFVTAFSNGRKISARQAASLAKN